MTIAEIPDLKNWELSPSIGELDRGHIAVGQAVEIRVIALPFRRFHGHVKNIGGTTGPPWNRRFDCHMTLDDPSPELRAGMNTEVVITTEIMKNVLSIPSQALFESDGRTFVWVPSATGFAPRDVKLVRRSESQAVITGLQRGADGRARKPGRTDEEEIRRIERHEGDSQMSSAPVISANPRKPSFAVQILWDLRSAIQNLREQKTRTMLTGLGIVFGVGAVIGMLAIGAGARQESLRFIEELGVRNLLVESRPASGQQEFQERRRNSPGLTERDVRILEANLEGLELLSPRKSLHPAKVLPKPAHHRRRSCTVYARLTARSIA